VVELVEVDAKFEEELEEFEVFFDRDEMVTSIFFHFL
jgi:hypothetical protein